MVSDTAWSGYKHVPALVGQGYTILADEALDQIAEQDLPYPTYVFLQAGVGGVAASVSAHLCERLGRHAIRTIVVEPDRAACLLETARAGEVRSFIPTQPTIMATLQCYTPSVIGWRVLERTADVFMTVSHEEAKQAMRRLARRMPEPVVAGESGAAGLAGLLALAADADARHAVGIDANSRILLINTEGATDPVFYETVVGASADSIRTARGDLAIQMTTSLRPVIERHSLCRNFRNGVSLMPSSRPAWRARKDSCESTASMRSS